MLKRSVLSLLTIAVFPAVALAGDAGVLIRGEKATIKADEYRLLIEGTLNDSQKTELLGSEQKYREYLANYYLIRELAAEAAAKGIGQDAATRQRLQYEQERTLANLYLVRLGEDAKKPDFEQLAKERYLAEKESYKVPEQVRAEHILIATGDKRTAEEARKLAEQLHKQLVAGASFADLAKEKSDDPSSGALGGDLGFFPREKMVKPFADAAFALKAPGDISQPVQSPFGYHIIRLVDRKKEGMKSFEEVKPSIIQVLEGQFEADVRKKKIEEVTSAKNIKTDNDAVSELFKSLQP
ncbi:MULTISPECIES: peptidyl-prolyl cis-trans isomerase [unclassified Pseudomonas]|uniref:peptidylprolyl isomerase n=1 Tax=unclassified Pseudomonas TaxID=196821 RepID=UPI00244CBB1C|nr:MULTISPECIES: peptidyl-prolyl cis-trans isomerase [unclassified Pseudomonas]MDH0896640.1 peptidyl-prolyl cis-trans isomerase [Pseudomonas sp. GD03875]MDH1066419.1 peptidyl-prolyl cis-trans isomerase [Pseudomonas sp. GD03985]